MKASNIAIVCLMLLAAGCTQVNNLQDLEAYVHQDDHGLQKQVTSGPVNISFTYKPRDILLQQSLSSSPTSAEVDSLRNNLNRFEYFILSISADKKEIEAYNIDKNSFGARVQLLSYELETKLKLIADGRDTIPLADYAYQRTYGVGTSSDFLLAVDAKKIKDTDKIAFVLSDIGLGLPVERFLFNTEDITSCPQVLR